MAVSRFNPDYPDAGLVQVVPTSVSLGSGSATTSGNGTVTCSGATAVALNGCFTNDYDHYRVICSLQGSADSALNVRFRASGTDTTTGYYGSYTYMVFLSTTVNGLGNNNGNAILNISSVVSASNTRNFLVFDVGNPYLTQNTHVTSQSLQGDSYWLQGAWKVSNTTQYDGVTIFPSSGNITGTISVYGYRK